MRLVPVILSGGSGTRLWPLSRTQHPKQVLALCGNRSLIQQTALRVSGIEDATRPVVVANESHRFIIKDQLEEVGLPAERIILEPEGRNTAPALTLAALYVCKKYGDAIMFIMPADHSIPDQKALVSAIDRGREFAEHERLVTFGIHPTRAETGYGYIKEGEDHRVERFVEKPDARTAQIYVDSGDYYWNSGMFMFTCSQWLQEQAQFNQDIVEICTRAYNAGRVDGVFFRPDAATFRTNPNESIDVSVMERTSRATIVPLEAGWSDIGSWSALRELGEQDVDGNVTFGDTCLVDTHGSYVYAQNRLVTTLGVKDLVVVETADAVLVTDTAHAQEVKTISQLLKQKGRVESDLHRRVYRPWGFYDSIDRGDGFQVKRITVKPGAALSLQRHKYRAEHWVVVSGEATVTRGDEMVVLKANESTYIPLGTRHRLENRNTNLLEIIEIQTGHYLGEDDIERFDDEYNRD